MKPPFAAARTCLGLDELSGIEGQPAFLGYGQPYQCGFGDPDKEEREKPGQCGDSEDSDSSHGPPLKLAAVRRERPAAEEDEGRVRPGAEADDEPERATASRRLSR